MPVVNRGDIKIVCFCHISGASKTTMSLLLLLLTVISVTVVNAAVDEDRVLFLPGLDVQPTFNHYAGYLKASGTKNFFYW